MSATAEQLPRIRVLRPHVGLDTAEYIVKALDMGWLGMGTLVKEFEEGISAFLGGDDRRVVSTNTGTAAIHIALLAAGIGRSDEVITPSFNYVADHQAIVMAGAEPVMCDIRDDDLGIDCDKAEALISPRTKAIIPLHFAGIPCDQAGVYALARRHGLRVIEDACHGFGTSIDGRRIGSYGDIACFSFDPVKVVTAVDGGCVVTSSEVEVDRLRYLRQLGVDKDTLARYRNTRMWEYDVVGPGFRYHLNDVAASVGLSQLRRANEFIASRRAVCQRYNAAFGRLPSVRVAGTDFSNVSPFIYSLRVLDDRRADLIHHLAARNVETGIHFVPVHGHTFFKAARRGDMTVTDKVVREVLTLPLHSNMRPDFVERVIEGVTSFFD